MFFSFCPGKKYPVILLFGISLCTTGCMTSARQNQLQSSINQLQVQIDQLQAKIHNGDEQITSATKASQDSQSSIQNVQDQIKLLQGAQDELNMRLKKLEASSGDNGDSGSNLVTDDVLTKMQRQIGRLSIVFNPVYNSQRTGKLSTVHSEQSVNRILKFHFDRGDFGAVIKLATIILNAQEASTPMMTTALEYRGEAKFQLHDYRGVVSDLGNFVDVAKDSPRYSRALLLIGDAYIYLKNNILAASYYRECSQFYGTSSEGKAAEGRLSSLEAKGLTK